MKRMYSLITLLVFAFSLTCATAADSVLFRDNFESGNLDQWTGVLGGAHHGVIVVDPLHSANHVLTFTALNAGGDIFTAAA